MLSCKRHIYTIMIIFFTLREYNTHVHTKINAMRIILLGLLFILSGSITAQTADIKPGKTSSTCTNKTDDTEQQTSLPESFKGNWFSAEQPNKWEYGIYDSITIMQNRIFKNINICIKKEGIELTIRDKADGKVATLLLNLEENNNCRISVNGTDRNIYTKNKSSAPPVVADNGYQDFFRKDSVCLQGYIDGYNPELGFETGMIYHMDELTQEDYPTVVPIHPDGSFQCKFLVTHPASRSAIIQHDQFPFYIEPGQTLTLYINWNDIQHRRDLLPSTLYMGPSASLSYLITDMDKLLNNSHENIQKLLSTLTPSEYKEYMRPIFRQWKEAGDSLSRIYAASSKAGLLIRYSISRKSADALFNFLLYRESAAARDTANPVLKVCEDESYHDFLKEMPLNDETLLAVTGAHIFINRFEYMKPLEMSYAALTTSKPGVPKSQIEIDKILMQMSINKRHWKDSIINKLCDEPNPLLWQIAKVRSLKNDLQSIKDKEIAREHTDCLKKEITHPVLIATAEELYQKFHPEEGNMSYQLPEGKATEIFRSIIRNHPGKVLYINFWATTCGPCRKNIEATADLRKRYRNHPKFQFIYISGKNESPQNTYEKYVEKNLKGEACYYVTGTEFNYLRQLFHFNGIPHYELVEEDGSISKENLNAYNIEQYLEKRFGTPDSGNTP